MSKKIYFTPGPTELYFTVEGHLRNALREQIPSISHRSQQFKDIYKGTTSGLKQLFNLPEDYSVFFTSSATEVWEYIIRNCVSKESYHLVNGAFSRRFWEFAGLLGKLNGLYESPDGSCANPASFKIPTSAELLGITLNETSTGVAYPPNYLKKLRLANPDVLIAIDGVSSLPVPELDFSQVDTVYFSVQKCFGLPAGLGVWIVGPRCLDKAAELDGKGELNVTHRSLLSLHKKGQENQTIETPNILNIYLLGKVVEDMLTKGMDMIRRESKYKAAVLSQVIEDRDWLTHFVEDPAIRSETVTVAKCEKKNESIIDKLYEYGFVIGGGYGSYKTKHLRFSNFPTHSKEQVERLSDVIASF